MDGTAPRLCSYVICDPYVKGFPIRYPSQGFLELFGLSVANSLGHHCGELVGSKSIFTQELATENWVKQTELSTALAFLNTYCGRQIRRTVRGKQAATHALLINRRKSGELLVCELVAIVPRHPTLAFRYFLGLQRDLTAEIPVSKLVKIICMGSYAELLAGRTVSLQEQLAMVNMEDNMAYLHQKAAATKHALMSRLAPMLSGDLPELRRRWRGPPNLSIASQSTCCDGLKASNMTASSDSETEQEDSVMVHANGACNSSDPSDSFDSAMGVAGSSDSKRSSSEPSNGEAFSGDSDEEGGGACTPCEPSQVRLQLVEELREKGDIRPLPFPMCIVDATETHQRIVECTDSFASLTGYEVSCVLGSGMKFLMNRVPAYLWDAEATARIKEICANSSRGVFLELPKCTGLDFAPILAAGELLCEQVCAKKGGELFRSLVLMKQVEIDDEMFLLMFHERVQTPADGATGNEEYQALYALLCSDVDIAQKTLASRWFFSAPPRRQIADT